MASTKKDDELMERVHALETELAVVKQVITTRIVTVAFLSGVCGGAIGSGVIPEVIRAVFLK